MFWRKKKNQKEQEQEAQDDALLHPEAEPEIEPCVDYQAEITPDQKQHLEKHETQILEEIVTTPTPEETVEEVTDEVEEQGGWVSRLKKGLSKSSDKLGGGLVDLLTKRKLDDAAIEELEDALIMADLGPKTAAKIVQEFSANRFGKDIEAEEIKSALSEQIANILSPVAQPLTIEGAKPFVILVCGVNGVGKTTTIGKLAAKFKRDDKSVILGAGDTFRAAAVEQLQIWGDRNHVPVIAKDIGADAAAVAFESLQAAKDQNADVLMIDTAGRLHNKKDLMEELAKVVRVLKKQDETAPHACLLVLDGTTGQNAHSQVEAFKEMVDITGLIVTKLDGSAKGGVVVSLADQFGLPVHAVGVGEGVNDLNPFGADDYAKTLLGIDNDD